MSLKSVPPEAPPRETVRKFLDALGSGRVLDALDTFAIDAVVRDANGNEHRRMREIAKFVNRLAPQPLQIENIQEDRDTVTAIVRSGAGGKGRRMRHTYTVGGGRLQSLRIEGIRGRSGRRPQPR